MAEPSIPKKLPQKDILGQIAEICIVTPDLYSTIDGLTELGIGPFQVFNFNSMTVKNQEVHGLKGDDLFSIKVAFAKQQSGLVFEVMQPTNGPSLMQEFLHRSSKSKNHSINGQGIQHVAFDMNDLPMAERQRIMKDHGFEPAMQGIWVGKKGTCHFCFFDTLEKGTGTVFETIDFSADWEDPDDEGGFLGWYPKNASSN